MVSITSEMWNQMSDTDRKRFVHSLKENAYNKTHIPADPIAMIPEEGGTWVRWELRGTPCFGDYRGHAILFGDGWIFDFVNGWRRLDPNDPSTWHTVDHEPHQEHTMSELSMNLSAAIFVINDQVRAVGVSFQSETYDANGSRRQSGKQKEGGGWYTYKTFDHSLKVDDLVIVESSSRGNHGFAVCRVETVDVPIDVERSSINYKWIVGKLDREHYDQIRAQEARAIDLIRDAQRQRKRKELRDELFRGQSEKLLSLPLATPNGDQPPPPPPPLASNEEPKSS